MTDDSSTDGGSRPIAGPPHIGGVRVVGIPVSDQGAALQFYVGVLGFAVQVDAPMPQGGRWILIVPPDADDGAVSIALVPATDDAPTDVETGIRFHTSDAAATHTALLARGVAVGELLRWPGVPAMFKVSDGDGNRFEIIE